MSRFLKILKDLLLFILNFNFASYKGAIGEQQVKYTLESLNPELYFILHDLYIPIDNGRKTSQVDHVVLSPKGIFVIETKNYKGWITGAEQSQYWKKTFYQRKDRFNNPIWQNYGHIKALKEYLGEMVENVPFYSIIVFGDQAQLKFQKEFKNAFVIKRNMLIAVIKETGNHSVLNYLSFKKIQQKLQPISNLSKDEKLAIANKHKSEIRTSIAEKNNSINENICPRCGSHLLERKGKYGTFKGCSHYPKCKFTA
jgi:hypothetical protein